MILLNATNDLDALDIKLLAHLQADASGSIAQLADAVHLSHNACWRRVRRLEEAGYIRKRVALLDAARLGAGVTVFVTVRAAEHSQAWLAAFAAAVQAMPEVVEFYRMSGEVDYLLKIQVGDIAAYDRVYQKLIASVRLSDVSSAFAMEQIKSTTAVPLPAPGQRG